MNLISIDLIVLIDKHYDDSSCHPKVDLVELLFHYLTGADIFSEILTLILLPSLRFMEKGSYGTLCS